MNFLRKTRKIIDKINEWSAMVFKWTLVIICVCLTFEVVARYIFGSPTIWAQDISRQALCVVGAMGGSYVLLYNNHVKVDVFYGGWSERTRGIVDIFTSALFFMFVGLLFVRSFEMAADSFYFKERATTIFAPPLYPIKIVICVGTFLLLIQGVAKLIHDIIAAITGKSEDLKNMDY